MCSIDAIDCYDSLTAMAKFKLGTDGQTDRRTDMLDFGDAVASKNRKICHVFIPKIHYLS